MSNFNSIQTQITTELLEELPKDVIDSLNDHLENIEFIRNLINPNRKFAKDLDRDEDGKIIVNITNPHILEDTDYFRPLAIEFEMNGKYTSLFPNPARTSEYRKFWDEQRDRCINGYVRESDGEWIPGSFYFYLNFCRIPVAIAKTVKQKSSKKNKRSKVGKAVEADRILKHPDFWDGDYLYYHYLDQAKKAGKHANVLKTRGRGFSFKGGEMLAEGYFFYDNSNNYAVAAHENFLTNDGLLTKAWDIIDDVNINTPFTKTALPKSPMKRVTSYIDANGNVKGTKSAVIGISLKNDIEKHRGKRGRIMLFEESGVFPKLNTAWDIARNSFEQDDLVFGLMISFGTGGTKGNRFESAKEFIYNPVGYGILPLKNVFDKSTGSGMCSFWSGIYLNTAGAYDKNGNSDVVKALIRILYKRWEEVQSGIKADTILQRKAENAITPQEAILSTSENIFPVQDSKDVLAEIKTNLSAFISKHYVGLMGIKEGEVVFNQKNELTPIRNYPVDMDSDRTGAIEVFKMPAKGTKELSIGERYVISVDPVRYDKVLYSVSLASIFVFDLWLDEIAAEYTCRPESIEDFNTQLYRLAVWYNAEINYENDITDIFTFFRNKNALYYLADTPEIIKSLEIAKEGRGNRQKGTPSGIKLNNQARLWLVQWLKSPVKNADEDSVISNLHKIPSIGLLEEIIAWSIDGNYDRISSMGILMVSRKDKLLYLESNMTQEVAEYEEDEFFNDDLSITKQNEENMKKFDLKFL